MAFRVGLSNFSKGELGPELLGRVDIGPYQAAVARARNVMVRKYGGLTRRPGTRHIAEVHESDLSKPVRLIPFQFSIEQAYALELGQGYMRPAANGGMVTEEELVVTGATRAHPVVLTAAYHNYVAGDEVFLTGIEGMVELNGRVFTVLAAVDGSHFSIDVDGNSFGAFTGNTGGITRVADPTPPPAPPTVPPVVTPPTPPTYAGGGFWYNGVYIRIPNLF